MSSVHVKCITKYTREVSLACECTRAVLSVLVKCVLMHAHTFFQRKCTWVHAKIVSKSQILEKYSVIPRKKLAKARVSLRASVKLNLSCTVNGLLRIRPLTFINRALCLSSNPFVANTMSP